MEGHSIWIQSGNITVMIYIRVKPKLFLWKREREWILFMEELQIPVFYISIVDSAQADFESAMFGSEGVVPQFVK